MLEIGRVINHKITITSSMNKGFIVKIGCGIFVAKHTADLIIYLESYLKDPSKYESEYAKLDEDVPEAPTDEAPTMASEMPPPQVNSSEINMRD